MYKITIEDKDGETKEISTEGFIISTIHQEGMDRSSLVIINGNNEDIMNLFMVNFYSNYTDLMKKRFYANPELFDIFNKTTLMIQNLKETAQASYLRKVN